MLAGSQIVVPGGGERRRQKALQDVLRVVADSVESRSSHSVSCCLKSGRFGGQKPQRLLRRRKASTRWMSDAVTIPRHAVDKYVSLNTIRLPETLLVVRRQTPVVPQYSQSIQRLRTLADDIANVVLSELFRVMSGSGGG